MIANELADPIELHSTLNPKLWDGEHLKPDLYPANGALELLERGSDLTRRLGIENKDEVAGHGEKC